MEAVIRDVSAFNPGIYFMLMGTNHVVICCDGEIVHDPSPHNSGIIGPSNNGNFFVEFLVPLCHMKPKK